MAWFKIKGKSSKGRVGSVSSFLPTIVAFKDSGVLPITNNLQLAMLDFNNKPQTRIQNTKFEVRIEKGMRNNNNLQMLLEQWILVYHFPPVSVVHEKKSKHKH